MFIIKFDNGKYLKEIVNHNTFSPCSEEHQAGRFETKELAENTAHEYNLWTYCNWKAKEVE